MSEPWLVPASYAQERVWFASQLANDVPVYHVATVLRPAYPLSEAAMLGSLATLTERHEPLRTGFRLVDGELMQAVHPAIDLPVEIVDVSGEPEEAHWPRVEALFDEVSMRPIPLDAAPLWRAALVRTGEQSWYLVFVAHHAIYDGASEVNLRAELTELWAAAAQNRPASLPELTVQYADFTVWQRDQLAAGRLDELLGYWRKALVDLPVVHRLPTDRPRPPQRTFGGAEEPFTVTPAVVTAVADRARRAGATPFMVLLAAYAALLKRLTEQDDIVVGVPVAGRDLPELQPLLGMFVNMVVLRLDATGDPTFDELLARVRSTALAAWDHQDMPYQKLVEVLAAQRDPGVAPLYQLGFNYLPIEFGGQQLGFGGVSGTAEDEMMLEVADGPARLEYNTALFDPGTAKALVDGYQRVLETVLADPGIRLSSLPVTSLSPSSTPLADLAVQQEFVPPRTAAEELVAEVWAEVLGVDRVGAYDDFFDRGGHSLLALRVIARLSAATEIDIPIQEFFADTTVAGVAGVLERLLTAEIDQLSDDEAARLAAGGQA